MNTSKKSLLENLKQGRIGVSPFVNPVEDLMWKKEFNINSWFAIGHFDSNNHKLNYLFHIMIMSYEGHAPLLQSAISITDETTGWYYGEDKVVLLSDTMVSDKEFSLITPHGSMSGNLEEMHIQAKMPCGEINISMQPVGFALYNAGTGYFPLLDMNVSQYSLPMLDTKGTLTIDGTLYNILGISWFDRQWQNQGSMLNGHWSWMDLNLDNGNRISLWDIVDYSTGHETAWATILHTDGSQTVTSVEPLLIDESDYWISSESGQRYPTHWIVKIPTFDACLEVIPSPRKQEIVSQMPMLHKYEGASSVKGTYNGKETTGYCYVELVGPWK